MFNEVHLQNFGAFSKFDWPNLGRINVVVGENDTGKSHLLKVMYVVAKVIQAGQKKGPPFAGDEYPLHDMLNDELSWTFQPDRLSSLVRHEGSKAFISATLYEKPVSFEIMGAAPPVKTRTRPSGTGRGSMGVMGGGRYNRNFGAALPEKKLSPIFLPPKEILSSFSAIAATRETLEIYGFDNTYYDLIKHLRVPPTRGKIDSKLVKVLEDLRELFGGQIVKGQASDEFTFERGKRSYGMPQTADGIKKIGILTTLIENRMLNKNSVVFLDEPETNLHPKAITYLTKMLFSIAQAGAQVFVATHSYLVIKQLQILAKKFDEGVPFCSLVRDGDEVVATLNDLRDGMPDNPIVEESLRLYREELEIDLGSNKRS